MNKIGIVFHPMIEPAGKLARELAGFLTKKKVTSWVCSAWDVESTREQLKGTDLLLTVGGDGTILRAAQAVVPGRIPITGINLGKLGFMTELNVTEARESLDRLLQGEGWLDERALIEADVKIPGAKRTGTLYALNDVVVARGAVVRVISVVASLDNELLTTYRGDGVIVATATGSTGYALAAGGPILPPTSEEIVMVPIMPHLSANYPLVLPPGSGLRLEIQTVFPATISLDGHTNLSAESGSLVNIKISKQTLRFLRIHPRAYFYSSLDKRLKGRQ